MSRPRRRDEYDDDYDDRPAPRRGASGWLIGGLLVAVALPVFACGGCLMLGVVSRTNAPRPEVVSSPDAPAADAGEQVATAPDAAARPNEPESPPESPRTPPDRPAPGSGPVKAGAAVYDHFAEPWRSRFVRDWERQVQVAREGVNAAEKEVRSAGDATKAIRKEVEATRTRIETYRDRVRAAASVKEAQDIQKQTRADEKALPGLEGKQRDQEQKAKDAEGRLRAATAILRGVERNDPPYMDRLFAGCKTTADVERRAEEEARRIAEELARKKAEEEYDADGLVLLLKTVKGESNEFTSVVTGTVVNRCGRKLRYAQIKFTIYDESNAQIGTALANITDLEAGGRWNFKAVALVPNGAKRKLSELSGY